MCGNGLRIGLGEWGAEDGLHSFLASEEEFTFISEKSDLVFGPGEIVLEA
jgi:hypothetical protein